jgi:hypothetical protein
MKYWDLRPLAQDYNDLRAQRDAARARVQALTAQLRDAKRLARCKELERVDAVLNLTLTRNAAIADFRTIQKRMKAAYARLNRARAALQIIRTHHGI